jgi:conjugal transfer pilus assembly protein TraA
VNTATHSIVMPSRKTMIIASLIFVIVALMATAKAGVTGAEFQATYDLLVGWAKGYLGKIFAVAAFLIGCGFSAARQNPMPAIFGLVLALIIGFGPALIESILTATV